MRSAAPFDDQSQTTTNNLRRQISRQREHGWQCVARKARENRRVTYTCYGPPRAAGAV